MKRFRLVFLFAHSCCLLLCQLMSTGTIPKGIFAEAEAQTTAFMLNLLCIVQTLAVVPLVVHRLRRHSLLRLSLPLGVILYALLCYQFTLSTTGLLSAAIAYLTLWYIYATTLRHHRQL